MMGKQLQNLILIGVLAEVVIFLVCYFLLPSLEEVFRHSARYSGRLSAVVFMATFYVFATSYPKPIAENILLRNLLILFALLHLIHFGFLATNVYLNSIPLEASRLAGGAFAYLMIVAAPFGLHKLKFPLQLGYFYYVNLVMILTYLARIKGGFQGAESFWFHYVAMGILIIGCIAFGWMIFRSSNRLAS